MNNSTTPRPGALAVMTLLCLLVAQYAQAQCNVFKSGPLSNAPIPITLYLAVDPPNPSSVELTEADMPSLAGLSINTGCAFELSQDSNFTTTQSLPKVFTCDDAGTVPQTWYVRVAGSNGPSIRFYRLDILVIDDYAPLAQCPADLTLSTDPAACTRIVTEDIKVYTEDTECNAEEVSWEATNNGQAVADGLGDDATGIDLPQGVNIITYTVTDKSAKVTTCSFTITVEDTEGPTLTCPGDITLYADADCQATLDIESPIQDACNLSSWNVTLSDGQSEFDIDEGVNQSFIIGQTVDITLSGADDLGNAATPCTYAATLLDTIAPKITCPQSLTVNANASCEYEVTDASLDAVLNADNCSDLIVSVNMDGDPTYEGRVFPLGDNLLGWTSADNSGNVTTCEYTLTVVDGTAPTVAMLDSIVVNVAINSCSRVISLDQPDYADIAFSDNCSLSGNVTLTRDPIATVNGAADPDILKFTGFDPATSPNTAVITFAVGTTLLRYIWTDEAGNATTRILKVVVKETTPPVAKCKAGPIDVFLNASGSAVVSTNDIDAGSTDNCLGIKSLAVSPSTFNCTNLPGTPTVTLTVTDNSDNTATCITTVDVKDNLAPSVICPANQTVRALTNCKTPAASIAGLTLSLQPANTTLTLPGQYKDNAYNPALGCNTPPTVTYTLVSQTTGSFTGAASGSGAVAGSGVVFNEGTTTVTYLFNDGSNAPSVCSFNVTVADLDAPTVTCPANISLDAALGLCTSTTTLPAATATDNCTANPVLLQSHATGFPFPVGVTTVTYTAIDQTGRAGTCSFSVTVRDTQFPVAKCKDVTVYLNASGTATLEPKDLDNGSTDNCPNLQYGNPPLYTFSCGIPALTQTLTVRDGAGNTATCTSNVTVLDTIKPTALCASLSFVDLDSLNGAAKILASAFNNASSDNCALNGTAYSISQNGGAYGTEINFACADKTPAVANHLITLRVTDASGNTSTCTRQVTVRDVTKPDFKVPADVTLGCDEDLTPAGTGSPTNPTDACGPVTFDTPTSAKIPGNCPNAYTLKRTWSATDGSGNKRTKTQTIVVGDHTPPTFDIVTEHIIATDVDTFCDAPFTLAINLDSMDVTDGGCGSPLTISYRVNYPTPSYGYQDVTTPVFSTFVGDYFPIGTTEVTFYAQDACGNEDSILVKVIVQDKTAPHIEPTYYADFCDRVFVIPNTPGACSNSFSWTRPNFQFGIIDDCSSELGQSALTVTETISDPALSSTLNQSIPFNFYLPGTINNFNRIFPTAQFPVGITTVTYTATDNNQNSIVCQFIVEVTDDQAPKPICPTTQILPATCPTAILPDYRSLVLVTDNCLADLAILQEPLEGTTLDEIFPSDPVPGDSIWITITAADLYNQATCTFKVKLTDGQAPVPTKASLPDLVSYCGALNVAAPSATDPCNPNSGIIYATPSTPVQQLPNTTNPPIYVFGIGQYAVNWQYKDASNNISFQPQTIKVFGDTFGPVAKCKASSSTAPLFVDLSASGTAKIAPAFIDNGSADTSLCNGVLGAVTLLLNDSTFNCADLSVNMGKQVVTLQVKDVNGNTSTCSATIQVRDVTKPVLGPIPANVTIEACAQIPAPATVTATDQCPTLGAAATVVRDSVTTKTATGIGQYNYTITRRWTATDAAGNTSTGTQLITVKDTKAPVFSASAPATVTVNTETGSFDCKAVAKYKVSQYVSDCAKGIDLRVTSTPAGFSLSDTTETLSVGSHTYIFTAKDTTGNISLDTVTFVVKDATLPTAVCINGVSAALQASGTVVVTVNQFNNNSYDNCGLLADSMKIQRLTAAGAGIGLPSKTLTFNCADADNVTQHKVKLTVRDLAGNESTCQTYIVIQDNVKPTFVSCPPSKTVQCTDDLTPATQGTPTVTDNCTVKTPAFQDSLKAGSGSFCQVLKRTWSVQDQANNLSTCVQNLSIQDTIKPIFDLKPANATLSCEDPQIAIPTVTAKDNCDTLVIVTLKVDTTNIAAGACGMFSFTQKRTWTATDKCGNSQVHTQTITVTDAKAPQFLGLPDTLQFFSASFPATTNCTVPVEIDMGQYLKDCTIDTSLIVTHSLTSFAPNGIVIKGSFPVADYKLIVTAKDLCNNTGIDTVTLRVIDNSKPTLICNNNLVVALGTGSTAKITPADIDLGSTDNCAISKRILSDSTFDCSDVGDQTISMTATDVNGNTNVCTVVVKVTLGNNPGLVVTTVNGTESYFGAQDGTVSASTSGGSGNYSYQWSANANNATTNTVANLPPGTYTVTVTDTQTQCKGTATAVVTPGPKVIFKVGQTGGAQNSMIEIPVTVEHFTKIYSFSFSYEAANTLVASVTGTAATAAALTAGGTFNSTAAGVTWISNGTPLTLPANTVLFNLKVQLTAAPVGSTSIVRIFDGTPSLEVQQDSAGVAKVTMVTLVDGLATINAGSNDLKIGGDIQTWRIPVKPVPGATVNLAGTLTNTQTTPADGTYLFNVPNGANTVVSATKSTAGNQGITAADLLLIQNHIFGSTFTSPYQWVAANVNNSGGANPITLADYLIIQRVVLGTDQHLMGSPDWKFIPKSYTFPTPPLSAAFPQTIEHNPVTQDFLDDDFVAVRMGDVNGNVTPSMSQQESEDRSGETFRFRIPERAFRSGETFSVPFRASDFTERQAYQMTIEFDPTVFALEDIEAGVLPNLSDNNFGTARLSEGYLSTVWVGRDPLTLRDDEVLFSLRFRALRDGKALAEVLRPGSQVTAAEAYDRDGKTMKVDFEFVQGAAATAAADFALYQNQPNPFREGTTIGFRLPDTGRATLRVFNSAGQLVRMVVGEFAKGYNEVRFEQSELGTPGVYYYELESADRSDRKKMILMD